jgi:hypothetical protein
VFSSSGTPVAPYHWSSGGGGDLSPSGGLYSGHQNDDPEISGNKMFDGSGGIMKSSDDLDVLEIGAAWRCCNSWKNQLGWYHTMNSSPVKSGNGILE